MAARYGLKASFTRGEISPLAHARADIEMYQAAVASLENFLVLKEGGVRRRSGTRYKGATKGVTQIRNVAFVFSNEDAVAIEMGPYYARFWVDHELILSGGVPYEIATPYSEDDLRLLQWDQSGDTIYFGLASYTVKPRKLVRTANDNWTLSIVPFSDGPYLPINDQYNKLVTDAALVTGNTIAFEFENTLGINGGLGLVATDIGRMIRCQFNGKWSWGVINFVTSSTECNVTIRAGNGGGGAGSGSGSLGGLDEANVNEFESYSWRLGAFSDTTGYPSAVQIHQGRVFWAGTPALSRYVAYSRAGYPETFTPSKIDGTVTDDHGGAYDIVAGRSDKILWMKDAPRLQIGTGGSIRTMGATDTDTIFSPRSVSARVEIRQGVGPTKPETIGPSTVHTNRFGTAIHDLYYDYQVNSLVAPELSVTSDHMLDFGADELHFQQEPNATLWAILGDGTLCTTTVERYEKVIGWARQDVGGEVISGAVVPGDRGDELLLTVRRTINGQTVQYYEVVDPPFERDDLEYAFFVDCGATYDDTPTNTISGIDWLEGEEVSILADGYVLPNATITGGVLTLPNSYVASVVNFGKTIEAECTLLRAPDQQPDGPALGHKRRVYKAVFDLYETLGLQTVSDTGKVDELAFRSAATPMNEPSPLITGKVRALIDGGWESEGSFGFRSMRPLPATIRAINIGIESEP